MQTLNKKKDTVYCVVLNHSVDIADLLCSISCGRFNTNELYKLGWIFKLQ